MIQAVKGTRDILPPEVGLWQRVESEARGVFSRYGFREIRTPIFEATELFARGVGEGTDIVSKEMYTFADRKGRSLTLRPENTAPVARAYLEHGLERGSDLVRLYYIGPMFRYERPQKGRTRQFAQIGVEVLGSEHPAVDAETLQMLMAWLAALQLGGLDLLLNSVGDEACRPAYRDLIRRELQPVKDRLCMDCRRRLEENPLRVLDCKVPADREFIDRVSPILDHLCAACRTHLDGVRAHLDTLGVAYRMAPHLVRGLDYYRRTTFEVAAATTLGAQNALLGGGRYDGLVQSLGGPPIPGFGFAVGEDRLVMSLPPGVAGLEAPPDFSVVCLGETAIPPALVAVKRLRDAGFLVVLEPFPERSLKAQLRRAGDLQARAVLILGSDEVAGGTATIKRMADGAQISVPADAVADAAREVLGG
jgi:histidyl-tRNA synthetase